MTFKQSSDGKMKVVIEGLREPTAPKPLPENATLHDKIVHAIRQVYDPEIPVNLFDLGLIYGIDINAEKHVTITMTLTTPHCPVADLMPTQVRDKVKAVEGVTSATVNLVWEPAWTKDRMSDAAKLELGLL